MQILQRKRYFIAKTLWQYLFLLIIATNQLNANTEKNNKIVQVITPSNVLAQVNTINAELELIRQAMGKPMIDNPPYQVKNASPREVYFEAQALFDKANRLTYEITGVYVHTPMISYQKNLKPKDVLNVVNQALSCINLISQALSIDTSAIEKQTNESATPTDVFNRIIFVNAMLDHLLYQKTSPADVYEQVTLSLEYVNELLSHFDTTTKVTKPEFIANKTPKDVFFELVNCLKIIKELAISANIQMLSVNDQLVAQSNITPNDVYNISKVILAEIKYLDNHIIGDMPKRKIFSHYPSYKTPSQVYQQAAYLRLKLKLLEKTFAQHPNWINQISNQGIKQYLFTQLEDKDTDLSVQLALGWFIL
ncbi:hypothetical protein L3V82_08430 [Thiotrichales bacterium 19S3-7]|nr:hypothetical protein [Thiotrichales bacterium 19S3-7]MCF6802133.1 hypothetical protein [Thiotrichales bacterium 19S3-11]